MKETARLIEIRIWVDATGSSGSFTKGRLDSIVDIASKIVVKGVQGQGISVRDHGGDWVASYPLYAGDINGTGRRHTVGM